MQNWWKYWFLSIEPSRITAFAYPCLPMLIIIAPASPQATTCWLCFWLCKLNYKKTILFFLEYLILCLDWRYLKLKECYFGLKLDWKAWFHLWLKNLLVYHWNHSTVIRKAAWLSLKSFNSFEIYQAQKDQFLWKEVVSWHFILLSFLWWEVVSPSISQWSPNLPKCLQDESYDFIKVWNHVTKGLFFSHRQLLFGQRPQRGRWPMLSHIWGVFSLSSSPPPYPPSQIPVSRPLFQSRGLNPSLKAYI